VRQDKLLELLFTQLRGNVLPWLAFRQIERQSDGILHSSLGSEATLASVPSHSNSALKKPATS
jgi:hypothetical protein